MTQVIGFSTVFLPHQAPPLLVTIQMGGIKAIDLIKICNMIAMICTGLIKRGNPNCSDTQIFQIREFFDYPLNIAA